MSKSKKSTSKPAAKAPKGRKRAGATESPTRAAVESVIAKDAAANAHVVNPDLVPLREATAKPKRSPAQAKEKKASGLDAAAQVLADAGQPMRCKELVETMISKGLWKTEGKTPAATLYAAILREIQAKGEQARFKKADRGLFAINGK